jgi:hypothetical protein
VLVLRFEAEDQQTLHDMRKIFTDKLARKGLGVK